LSVSTSGTATTAILSTTTVIADSNWHHVVAERSNVDASNNVLKLALDGTLEAQTAIGASPVLHDSSEPWYFGAYKPTTVVSNFLDGQMEEISLKIGTPIYFPTASSVSDIYAVPTAPYVLPPQNFRLPSVAIECDVAPTKVYAQLTVESGAPYDTIVANTDLKAYIAQTGNEDPDDVGFVGNELTLVPAGTVTEGADTFMLYEVENQAITGGTVDGNKFIIHGPNADDFRVHDATVLLS